MRLFSLSLSLSFRIWKCILSIKNENGVYYPNMSRYSLTSPKAALPHVANLLFEEISWFWSFIKLSELNIFLTFILGRHLVIMLHSPSWLGRFQRNRASSCEMLAYYCKILNIRVENGIWRFLKTGKYSCDENTDNLQCFSNEMYYLSIGLLVMFTIFRLPVAIWVFQPWQAKIERISIAAPQTFITIDL